jgi:hypothetical protein
MVNDFVECTAYALLGAYPGEVTAEQIRFKFAIRSGASAAATEAVAMLEAKSLIASDGRWSRDEVCIVHLRFDGESP